MHIDIYTKTCKSRIGICEIRSVNLRKLLGQAEPRLFFFPAIARKRSAETSPIGPDVATSGMVAKTARLGSHCIKSDHLERR